MRCFFFREDRIEAVYYLTPGSDEDLVRQGRELFDQDGSTMDGFEVWNGKRLLHRFTRAVDDSSGT